MFPAGTLLFLVYINNLLEVIIEVFVSVFLIADTSKLLVSGSYAQLSLSGQERWDVENGMEFLPKKMKTLVFYGEPRSHSFYGTSNNVVESHRYLGLTIFSNLGLSENIAAGVGKAYRSFHQIKNVLSKFNTF